MTKVPPALNLVHESETQRQHVRVRVPGVVEIEGGKTRMQFRLHDLSAGGIGFEARNIPFKVGQMYSGRLSITIEPIAVTIPIGFVVRHYNPETGRVGAQFEEMSAAEISSIRRVVSAYLGGEIIGVGDVVHTLSRNNFTPPRGGGTHKRSFAASVRAATVTALMLVAGVAALAYSAQRINEKVFTTSSVMARVSGPRFEVTMPRDGVFYSLVSGDRVVKKGAPIGSFETTMLDLVRGQALKAELPAKELEALLDRTIKGTITSPCDCRVQALYAADQQYVGKGQPIATLEPIEFEPYVVARFNYPGAERLAVGSPVSLRIDGEASPRRGRVTQLRTGSDADSLNDSLVVIVTPDEPLPVEMVSRPVHVVAEDDLPVEAPRTMVSSADSRAPVPQKDTQEANLRGRAAD